MGKKLTADMIPEGYRFAAVDRNGMAYAFEERPSTRSAVWDNYGDKYFIGPGFDASGWRNSLIFKKDNNMENLQQLEKQIAELSAKLEDLKKQAEEKKKYFPKSITELPDRDCYYVTSTGNIEEAGKDRPDFVDLPTRQHAVSQRAANQLMNLIHAINNMEDPDSWMWTVFYSVGENRLFVDRVHYLLRPFLAIKNKEDAEKSMEIHRNLWIEYFTGEEQPK